MSKKKVGIIRGGPSHEHEVSLNTAENVLKNLPDHYEPYDIFIAKNGDWYLNNQFAYPEKVARSVDVVFNAVHGQYGEDGSLQQVLDTFGVPYTGSGQTASLVGMNKFISKKAFESAGLFTPRAITVDSSEDPAEAALRVYKKMGPQLVVKPNSSGSSVGVSVVDNLHDLARAISDASRYDSKILIEEYIKGKEATVGVIDNFRNKRYYALPVIEIIPPSSSSFFDIEAKYSGEAKEMVPANFPIPLKRQLEELAIKSHNAIGARHYSRTDFIITPKGKIYVLETNTLPGFTKDSLMPKALDAVGVSYSEFLDHLIKLALKR